jgi:hypothetical protein
VKDGEAVSNLLRAFGVVSADERGTDGGAPNRQGERKANGSRGLGIQQQSGWNRFFDHGLDDLIPDTEANGGGCLVVYDDTSVKKLGSAGEKEWEESYETNLNDLLPVSEANGGGYLIAFDHELVRLGRDGSSQWKRSYGDEGMDRRISSVIEAGSNGFLFAGSTRIDDDWDVSWVAKVSGDGEVTWELAKTLLGSRQAYGQSANRVYRANSGYLIEVRRYHSLWLVKIDESGSIEWNLEFTEYADIYVTDEDSILVAALYDPRLIRVTSEGTIQWTKESESTNLPEQVLAGEDGFLVAGWSSYRENYVLNMLRDDGTRRWWREYEQAYTVAHAEPDGYVLFGTESVLKVNADGTKEWERPVYVPTDIEHLYDLDDGGYLLGGGGWIALRESLADGVAVLPDVNGDGNPSQDPDGDGLYEDVNGDGSVNVGDAQALYENRESAAIRINGELYDFNDDGTVNVGDAQALFAEVTEDD